MKLPLLLMYCKILIISPGLLLFKRLFGGLIFGTAYFVEGLITGWDFAFQNGLDLTRKSA